jgi:hypothetical protein
MERGRVGRVPLVGGYLVPDVPRRVSAAAVASMNAFMVPYAVWANGLDEASTVHVPIIVSR